MAIASWLLSTRAQNIPFKHNWLLIRVIFLSIFTFEHILCILLSLIYRAVYLFNKDRKSIQHLSNAKKGDIFWKKRMEGIFVYVLESMLTLVSLDKMQNIVLSCAKIQNLRAGHFQSYSSETGLSPPVKYLY